MILLQKVKTLVRENCRMLLRQGQGGDRKSIVSAFSGKREGKKGQGRLLMRWDVSNIPTKRLFRITAISICRKGGRGKKSPRSKKRKKKKKKKGYTDPLNLERNQLILAHQGGKEVFHCDQKEKGRKNSLFSCEKKEKRQQVAARGDKLLGVAIKDLAVSRDVSGKRRGEKKGEEVNYLPRSCLPAFAAEGGKTTSV